MMLTYACVGTADTVAFCVELEGTELEVIVEFDMYLDDEGPQAELIQDVTVFIGPGAVIVTAEPGAVTVGPGTKEYTVEP